MRILVTEHSDHFSLLKHLDELLEEFADVTYAFRLTSDQHYWKSIFNTTRLVKVFDDTSRMLRELRFFGFIFLYGFKVQKIIVNTGPEYESGKMLFLSLVAYLPHRQKLIYTVRNPSQINRNSIHNKTTNQIKKLVLHANALVFENQSVANRIYEIIPVTSNKPFAILYTYFFDMEFKKPSRTKNNDVLVIGLLGTISPERRDYELVLEALKKYRSKHKRMIRIVFLGSTSSTSSAPVINLFKEAGYETIFENGWLSDQKFVDLGQACDVLLAPLKFGLKEYGFAGSTGAFGDAIRLRKPLLIPEFSDRQGEFESFSTYYNSANSLYESLEAFYTITMGITVTPEMLNKFGKQKAASDLRNLIEL